MLSYKRIYFKVVVSSLGNKNVNFILKEYILTLFQRHYWSFHLILWSKHERKNFKCSILLKQLIRDIYKLNWSRVEGYRSIESKPSQAQPVEAVSRWIATVLDTDPLYRSVWKCKSPILQYTADRVRCLFLSVIRHSNKLLLLIVTSL